MQRHRKDVSRHRNDDPYVSLKLFTSFFIRILKLDSQRFSYTFDLCLVLDSEVRERKVIIMRHKHHVLLSS